MTPVAESENNPGLRILGGPLLITTFLGTKHKSKRPIYYKMSTKTVTS